MASPETLARGAQLIEACRLSADADVGLVLATVELDLDQALAMAAEAVGGESIRRAIADRLAVENDYERYGALVRSLVGTRELDSDVLLPGTRSPHVEIRREAAFALSLVSPPTDPAPFFGLLSDPDDRVGAHAACAHERWLTMRPNVGSGPYR